MGLTRDDILAGLRGLGVTEGMVLMVHSSLSAMGEVEGGADAVIDALAEAVGETGTLCMPAMSGDQPFRIESSPSNVGIITERFRSWPGVRRGLHPTHSVSCLGPKAQEIICNHIEQPTALGPESPWARIAAMQEGYLLFIGCDQDRNTLLHCAEEAVDAPYLKAIQRDYVDTNGATKTKVLERFPGPHRDFIGLESLFRDAGIMRTGKIGKALCRLMEAGPTLDLATAALKRDPAAVLCTNPNCSDCVKQRADITRHELAREDFTLAALADEVAPDAGDFSLVIKVIQSQGIDVIELGPELSRALLDLDSGEVVRLKNQLAGAGATLSMLSCPDGRNIAVDLRRLATIAGKLGAKMVKLPALTDETLANAGDLSAIAEELASADITLVVENQPGSVCDNRAGCESFLAANPLIKLAFNPANFAQMGEHPFLYTFYKGKLKRAVVQLYITDGCHPGGDENTLPGYGNGEVKELMSILRCRSFDGLFCLKMGNRSGEDEFIQQNKAFWRLMQTL